MQMKWEKLGKVFDPTIDGPHDWMQEFSQCPFPFIINSEVIRLYFACRPKPDSNRLYVSQSAWVDLDRSDPTKVLAIAKKPILELGELGTFDEFGSMTSSFVRAGDNSIYCYYTGWTRMQSVPYTMAIGMGISSDNGISYTKVGKGPVLGLTKNEPILTSGPIVHLIDNQWHMWHITGTKWLSANGKREPIYRFVHATSDDGIEWKRNGIPIIEQKIPDECQVSFALFQLDNVWNAIFSYRHPVEFRKGGEGAYKLGLARSYDLEKWERCDEELGLELSEDGWDSEMMCYPQVCQVDGRTLLFYCGNGFGRYGFGCAELLM